MKTTVFALIVLVTLTSTTTGLGQSARVYGGEPGYRSTGTGWLLAVAATAIPIAIATTRANDGGQWLGALGIVIGPSVGNLYAGDVTRGLTGIGVRTVGLLTAAAGVAASFTDPDTGVGLFLGGSALLVGSALFNVGTIGKSVEEFNKRHDGVAITPYLDPVNRGGGAKLSLKF